MKILIAIIITIVVFVQCHFTKNSDKDERTEAKKVLPNNKKDSLEHLINFLSLNCLVTNSFSIDKDTIEFLEFSAFRTDTNYYLNKYWFDFHYSFDTTNYNSKKITKDHISTVLKQIMYKPIFFKQIGKPIIKYETVSSELKNKLKRHKILITKETKFQKYDDHYFFVDPAFPMTIHIYDPSKDLLTSLHIEDDYFSIKNYFVFDLIGDGKPEIFIFSTGRRYGNDEMGFDAYTIQNFR